MRTYLYFKNGKYFSLENEKEIEIPQEKIEEFIKEKRGNIFYLIFSKLDCYFRKVEFEFKDRKKINLILSQELEGKLPKPVDDFYFYTDFYYPEYNKTIVFIYAVEKKKIDFFIEAFRKNKVKFHFTIDSILLYRFLKDIISEKNYIELFVEKDYLLINLVENSEISGVFSYFSQNLIESISDIFSSLLSDKKFPVYFIGDRTLFDKIELETGKFLFKKNIFEILKETKKFPEVSLNPLGIKKITIPFDYLVSLFFLIAISFLLIRPYFFCIEKEKKLKEFNFKMEEIYRSLFPETKKVINPLIQIKEKLGENENNLKFLVSEISIIKILEEVTTIFSTDLKNAEVEEFVFNGENVNLVGIVDNLKNLDIIKENFKKSKVFKSFEIETISFTKENRVRFVLILKM
ncbi:MAG: hypothetical protein ACP5OB_05025 [Candidatus Ratteibacteria bacterium]